MDNILYDIRWTSELDEKFIKDFLYVQNEVFKCGTREEFKRQFEDNIYGRSVVVVVYLNNCPVAARGLWRNDINGKEAYQPGSTCVLPICRGKGIFKEMTLKAIALLPTDSIIYNFPNSNSFPGYIKMGWECLKEYKARIFLSYKMYKSEHPQVVDDEYAEWWLKDRKLYSMKIYGHYFLVKKDRRPFCYHILAEVNPQIANKFQRKHWGIVFYKSIKNTWYNKRLGACHVVAKNHDNMNIPTWKIDAV